MALPAISTAINKRGISLKGGSPTRPKLLSVEGILMLIFAMIMDAINILLGFLDFVAIGVILSPIFNIIPLIFIGGWLWIRTGKVPWKKGLLPFGLNSLPLVKFLPFWFISVWTTLDKTPSRDLRDVR